MHLIGYQQNPYSLIKFTDRLVLTSKSEAYPNLLLEAIALGTIVILTRCVPDIDEIIEGSNKALVINGGDVLGLIIVNKKTY